MGIIKGDIRRALGYKTVTVNGLEIDLSKTKAKDIVDFQELPLKVGKGKKPDEFTTADLLEANRLSTQWFVDYLTSKDPELNKEDAEQLVVRNKQSFQKEFTIGFGIKGREAYEADEEKAKIELSKKAESLTQRN